MARPLVPIALVYAAGLLAGRFLPIPPWPLFATASLLVIFALAASRFRAALLLPSVFFVAWTGFSLHTSLLSPFDIRRLCPPSAQLVTIRGELVETPAQRIYQRNGAESSKTFARIKVRSLRRDGSDAFQSAVGLIQATRPGSSPQGLYEGQIIELSGVLSPPPGPAAPGLFDYGSYLELQGIYFQLKSAPGDEWRFLSGRADPPWADRFLTWAQGTLSRGLPEQDLPLKLLWAMTLGWKTGLDSEVYDPFIQSGTMHIFAISGLHIALIAGILVGVLRVGRVPRSWCSLIVIPLIWLYTAATGWQPSAIRSTIMMTIVIVGWALKRPSDLINSLAGAALIIFLWDPQQLFGASFQLSFFVVLSLALFTPLLHPLRGRWLEHDPLLPADLVPPWRRVVSSRLREIMTLFITSLAAWLGSLPLTACYFNIVNPISLVANMVVVPLSSAALSCNLASLACGSWLPALSELFNHSAWLWMTLMVKASQLATTVPGGFFYIQAPSLLIVGAYYALVLGALTWGLKASHRRQFWTAALVLLLCWGGWLSYSGHHRARLTILPTQGGLAIYCDPAGNEGRMLLDPGNTNAVEFVTSQYLRAEGANSCPTLVLTHGDAQHIAGTELIFDQFDVRQLAVSPLRFRSPYYRRLIETHASLAPRVRQVARGDRLGPFRVLHPEEGDRVERADEGSLSLVGTLLGTRILLLSDLGQEGQKMLLNRGDDLRADIVICGLPSPGEPLTEALLDRIQPRLIIVGDSEYPATARASPNLRARLSRRPLPVLYTRDTGALSIDLTPGNWQVRDARGAVLSPRGKTTP
jgi:ComEC/Rec2-related protein